MMQEVLMDECPTCQGSGDCPDCRGECIEENGEECPSCDGSGLCVDCDGDGKSSDQD